MSGSSASGHQCEKITLVMVTLQSAGVMSIWTRTIYIDGQFYENWTDIRIQCSPENASVGCCADECLCLMSMSDKQVETSTLS